MEKRFILLYTNTGKRRKQTLNVFLLDWPSSAATTTQKVETSVSGDIRNIISLRIDLVLFRGFVEFRGLFRGYRGISRFISRISRNLADNLIN
jgi:hypothetical protein